MSAYSMIPRTSIKTDENSRVYPQVAYGGMGKYNREIQQITIYR